MTWRHLWEMMMVMFMILLLSGCKREMEYRDVRHQIESETMIQ